MTTPAQKSSVHTRKGWHYLTTTLAYHLPYKLTQASHALHAINKTAGRK